MMKSTIRARTWKAVYRLLDRVSPVEFDCGTICGAVCCGRPEDDMGIYLLPGEEKIHSKKETWLSWSEQRAEDYEFPDSWKGKVYYVKCLHPPTCPRELRPLQCRTFPLLPHLTEDGELFLIYNDMELPYCCPLIEEEIELEPRFVQATQTVWEHLVRDPLIRDLVRMDSAARERSAEELANLLK